MSSNPLRIDIIEKWKTTANNHAKTDRIGHLMARSFDLISATVRDGVGSESVTDLSDLLAQDRAFVMKRDSNSQDPLRQFVFNISQSIDLMIKDIAEKRVAELQQIAQQNTIAVQKPNVASAEALSASILPRLDDSLSGTFKDELMTDDALSGVGAVVGQPELGETGKERAATYDGPGSSMQPDRKRRLSEQHLLYDGVVKIEDDDEALFDSAPLTFNSSEQRVIPAGPMEFRCTTCSRMFRSQNALSGHLHAHNSKRRQSSAKSRAPKYPCDQCSFIGASQTAINIHMCTHTGERPHKCPHCPEGFVATSYLKHHLRDVHGLQQYECVRCNEKFDRLSQLTIHKKNHYVPPVVPVTFPVVSNTSHNPYVRPYINLTRP